jgi:type II secretory pathway pseudopilin PulG
MSFDETTSTDDFDDAPLPEESNNNKTFMIAVGILGGIILLSVACLGGVYLFTRQNAAATEQVEAANVAATQTAQAFIDQSLTATFEAAVLPTTTVTVPPTVTPPVAQPSATGTPDPMAGLSGTQVAATATVGAAYTQAAAAALTVYPTTTALPDGGFADDYGLPGLVVMALAFVVVILFARRLRTVDTR